MGEFSGKVAIVTGGGSGIGRATAFLFAAEKSQVVVIDWNEATGRETAGQIESDGGQALFLKADVSQATEVKQAMDAVAKRFGTAHVLFANAAVQTNQALEETSEEDWDRMISVNLKGVFLCCKHVIPIMRTQKCGAIVICSSGHAFMSYPKYTAYAATKGGLVAFMRAAALDCAPYGIRVNCVVPGATDTPLLRYHLNNRPEEEQRIISKIPLGRFAQPEDVARAVRFLASSDAAYITGTTLVVDGGLLAQG
jgi:NAD(P)-dependent dehydrogenase (short-subunit alcohol dehydrogenase family)